MKILTTSTADQTIKVATRRTVSGNLRLLLVNKTSREEFNYTTDFQWQLYLENPEGSAIKWDGGDLEAADGDIFLEITNQYALSEGDYYTLKVIDDNGELYRDTIFCTDQTDYNKYEVGKGDYTNEDSYDNSFIII